ncbi:MAG: hypothetical protein ABIQ81_05095 [Novosphingobium sp.]
MATQFARDLVARDLGPAPATVRAAGKRYLIGPIADFWCFGGSALIILPLLLLLPAAQFEASLGSAMMLVAYAINYPHFAHSYQIFYRGFRAKGFTPALSPAMRFRYVFAGVAAPALLALFFAICLVRGDVRLLGYGANAMMLFVGWHYVKQGYGLLMVDCTLKRQFFAPQEKRILLLNSYAVWIASWVFINHALSNQSLWNIGYYMFALPGWLLAGTIAVAAGTTGAAAWMLWSRWRFARAVPANGLPVNGLIAYFASLYLWQAFVTLNPLWILVSPALHSLQYLAVVWRYQTNFERARQDPQTGTFGKVVRFSLVGAALGFCGFWLLPILGDTLVPYDKALFGGTALMFIAWVFINVHHYFIDNVMWRRENPDAKAYLFS